MSISALRADIGAALNINECIHYLTPAGTDAIIMPLAAGKPGKAVQASWDCPNWPADLFAIAAAMIERSGCYTEVSPDRQHLEAHADYLEKIEQAAHAWNADPGAPPATLMVLWEQLVTQHGGVEIEQLCASPAVISILLTLFAVADETCAGMGWDVTRHEVPARAFAAIAMGAMADKSS